MTGTNLRIAKLSRRELLGLGLTGPLALRWSMAAAASDAAELSSEPLMSVVSLQHDGSIVLRSPFVEGGQGIYTALAQLIAEELDIDPSVVAVECGPSGTAFPLMPSPRLTGQSQSIRAGFTPIRQIGATVRAMLLSAASARLGVSRETLETDNGFVKHEASGQSISYGQLAEGAAQQRVPQQINLRRSGPLRWIGKSVPRIDVPAKAKGAAVYTIDIKLDGMVTAAVMHPPRRGQKAGRVGNSEELLALRGILAVEIVRNSVAVVAQRWWQASRALERLEVEWVLDDSDKSNELYASFSTQSHREALIDAGGEALVGAKSGNVDEAIEGSARLIEATYDAPYLAHAQLEPPSAIARFNENGTLEVWCPNQIPDVFSAAAASIAGIPSEKVIVHSPLIGGFFGRHFFYGDPSPFTEAIILAQRLRKPVKVLWSREEEFLCDSFRPMSAVNFRAGLNHQGELIALDARLSGEGPTGSIFGTSESDIDDSSVEGLMPEPYSVPHKRTSRINIKSPARIGYWRSVGHSSNCFFVESFIDELASAVKQDPYAYRVSLLQGSARELQVLNSAMELSGGWKPGPFTTDDGSVRARGMALSFSFGSVVCTVAEISISEDALRVHSIWTAVDAGVVVNPDIVKAQIKSATCLGLSAALYEEVTFAGGSVEQRNFDGYPILTLADMPPVHVHLVQSKGHVGGVGEPGLPPVAPAVCNAIAALSGERIRSLPISRFRTIGK